jgi:hypothetical protein
MRTNDEIKQIKSRFRDPYSVENFLTEDQVSHLINLFDSQQIEQNKVYKNTGPITLDIVNFLDDLVVKYIFDQLKELIGDFELTAGFFFWTNYPHIIHNDDTFELPEGVYKGITLPLQINRGIGDELPKLCFFDQFYFHGPAKFFNKSVNIPTYYNKQIYEYSQVDGIVNEPFNDSNKLFTHLKPEWLEGLSLHSTLEWKPGNALIFDSVRLHCASDFRQLGIKSKLGISIFTRKL